MKNVLIFLVLLFTALFIPFPLQAAFVKSPNNPVLSIAGTTDWDSNSVDEPAVIYENNKFKMWYAGNNIVSSQIGYADSDNSINFLKSLNNPLIKSDAVNPGDIGVDGPHVIKNGNKYHMWFENLGNNPFSINLYYSNSDDGLTWSSPSLLQFNSSDSWDNIYKSSPAAVFNSSKNLYELWYTARGTYNNITHWRVGYATSSDGLNWNKYPTPVLSAEQSWEGEDVGNTSVLLENGIYHLWYHGDSGIGHATSTDGINWTKDASNPILTPDPSTFDEKRLLDPYVIKKDSTYYMYYVGIGNDDKYRIGLATANSLDIPTPSPTIPVTPTSTVTPSPSPTTVPPPGKAPVILVVGLGGSWNAEDYGSCDISVSHNWKLTPFVATYDRLIKTLKKANLKEGKDFYVYTYDWRQTLPWQATALQTYIQNILATKPPETAFDVVAHSFGGLVVRSYMDKNPGAHHIGRLLTAGTPHLGTPLAYPLWAGGESADEPLYKKALYSQLIRQCTVRPYKVNTAKEVIQQNIPSLQQLLPTFSYIRKFKAVTPEDQMNIRNNWLGSHPIPNNLYGIPINTLSGQGENTARYFDVLGPTLQDIKHGDWLDGQPINTEYSKDGDNTVLNLSSQIDNPNVHNTVIASNHRALMYSKEGIANILSFLNMASAQLAPTVAVPEDTSTASLSIFSDHPAGMTLTSVSNKTSIPSQDNLIIGYDLQPGVYTLTITPTTTTKYQIDIAADKIGKPSQSDSIPLTGKKNQPMTIRLQYGQGASLFKILSP